MVKGRLLIIVYVLAIVSVLALYFYASTLPPQEPSTSIEDILSDPEAYRDRGEMVECSGTMMEKREYEHYAGCEFRLEEGNYSIFCSAELALPNQQNGSEIVVTGYVSYNQHQGYWYLDVTNIIEK